ncbi:DUF7260 family protein [Halobellus rufus]|uniref:DUF7260 family protein n=1 Tax=Halobellus rufus TaxID=1448860 RepID=UPI000679C143|nr:hypothetical protein [Halobellus rufus]
MSEVESAIRDLTAARRAVRDELRETERQQRGFEGFRGTVAGIDPDRGVPNGSSAPTATPSAGSGPGWSTGASAATATAATPDDRCRRVRAAFEELVLPHVETETGGVPATIAAELSAEVAVALAAEGGGNQFTEALREAVLEHVDQRLAEGRVMLRALTRERDSLDDAIALLKRVDRELPAVDDSVVLLSTDEELWDRRRRVASLETDLEAALRDRQSTLGDVVASEVKAGIEHDTVVEYLFGERDVTYPALDALARAVGECRRRTDRLDSALEAE